MYPAFWGGFIILSQIITATRPHLVFKERLPALFKITAQLQQLACEAEHYWFDVSQGKITPDKALNLRMKIRKKKFEILEKNFPNGVIPNIKKFSIKAEKMTLLYFQTYYASSHDDQ
jgi:hypothetical protein